MNKFNKVKNLRFKKSDIINLIFISEKIKLSLFNSLIIIMYEMITPFNFIT